QLDERSNRLAHFFTELGLKPGDSIAMFLENNAHFLEIAWAAQRTGLYYTPISSRMTHSEVAYIVNDCGAKVLFTSQAMATVAQLVPELTHGVSTYVMCNSAGNSKSDPPKPYVRYEDLAAKYPPTPVKNETEGSDLLYSSGTTGVPKGVKVPRSERAIGTPDAVVMLIKFLYGASDKSIYLSPAPLYHAAPLRFTIAFTRIGATVVIMDHFEPVEYLSLIDRYSATHTQLVPTMFVRMLKLDPEVRMRFELSSLECAIHASAPCPIDVKRQIIEWWGPVINEYYAGTESNGFVACDSAQWLAHQGTVGKPLMGAVHIINDDGVEVGPGIDGTVYFEMEGASFEYLNDPEKTSTSRNEKGWTTLGDIGHLDVDGFLYLTDRKAYMIISGGVNIYPQEAENVLVGHAKVMDAAVFGIPNEEMGEEVKGIVELVDHSAGSIELAHELIEYCRSSLAHYKCPKSIEFIAELPRHANGKLYKRLLRDKYWEGHSKNIA
ncbi:MAG TPA: acyl-CoA synthetase, partial [Acidimicrobiales bacterium]|nr:acyl-CoA synthetase [Acidimicrobiales bacterium]